MILAFVLFFWNFFLFVVFVFLPIVFIFGFIGKMREKEVEPQSSTEELEVPESKMASPETYRTIKKEPGSYLVVGPDRTEVHVLRVETPAEGKHWIAVLVKNNTKSERVSTKKEAVALAIELLKDFKENTNGS